MNDTEAYGTEVVDKGGSVKRGVVVEWLNLCVSILQYRWQYSVELRYLQGQKKYHYEDWDGERSKIRGKYSEMHDISIEWRDCKKNIYHLFNREKRFFRHLNFQPHKHPNIFRLMSGNGRKMIKTNHAEEGTLQIRS
jgi:hypothetical protein